MDLASSQIKLRWAEIHGYDSENLQEVCCAAAMNGKTFPEYIIICYQDRGMGAMTKTTRSESDSIGSLQVPINAYYGVQTLRGYQNFQITGHRVDLHFIYNVVRVKKAAAFVNRRTKQISDEMGRVIVSACDEILSGKFDDAFITDCIQGGAGTTINMNVNEVIANRATELLGGKKGEYLCHPNDHVNCSQSTNDVIPTAGKLTTIEYSLMLQQELNRLIKLLKAKAVEFNDILKMGRTQMEDAVPIRLGQEFHAYASALLRCQMRILENCGEMYMVNLGGTAIGTAVNVKRAYLDQIILELSSVTGYPLHHAADLIDSTQNLDCFVSFSGALKALAITLSKICNDFRLMSSGPRTGFEEIILPAKQNGSSIMPGKINPVIPEVVSQVAFSIVGNDMTITMAAEGGQLELNAFEPVIFSKLFDSLTSLSNAMKTLNENCIAGITANKERCEALLMNSVGIVTALCPYIGYKLSAEIAKEALARQISIRTLILEKQIMPEEKLDKILNPFAMTEPMD